MRIKSASLKKTQGCLSIFNHIFICIIRISGARRVVFRQKKEEISKILYEKAFPYFNKETGIFDEELFFAEHPDAKVDKEKKEWKKFDEI